MKTCGRRILLFATRLCVVAMLVGCVCLSLVPRSTIASAFGSTDCCLGKSAGHCPISLRKKRPAPKPEPMCGIKSAADNVTVIANENEDPPESKAVTHPDPCNDCPRCTLGSKQRVRDKSFITTQQAIRPVTASDRPQEIRFQNFDRLDPVRHISLRGPPHL